MSNSCIDCSKVMKSDSYKRCYSCNYRKKHGRDIPDNTCQCGVNCKTFRTCYKCHLNNTLENLKSLEDIEDLQQPT